MTQTTRNCRHCGDPFVPTTTPPKNAYVDECPICLAELNKLPAAAIRSGLSKTERLKWIKRIAKNHIKAKMAMGETLTQQDAENRAARLLDGPD